MTRQRPLACGRAGGLRLLSLAVMAQTGCGRVHRIYHDDSRAAVHVRAVVHSPAAIQR
ncbi:MAG: hypothetical protein LC135_06395 [Phycisphaerae bacterium]|nr:hypothetical protein [Phycisphaerae bacterium]MCZ2399486.1 hypothetical protein [Phycisphaerae bacterium]NUQ50827.1 hypothetical protein [Phycisphaerae bacterium]